MNKEPKIIVITGTESTGKSTLTDSLSKHFNTPKVVEYAREYVENLNRPYNFVDIETIAKHQIKLIEQSKHRANNYVFVDTWLIIIQVWFEKVFNTVPDWIITAIKETKIDLFIVCDTDIKWLADPVRENGGDKRDDLQNRYLQLLKEYKFNYKVVRGKGKSRLENAISIVDSLN